MTTQDPTDPTRAALVDLLAEQKCPSTSGGTDGKWCIDHGYPMATDTACSLIVRCEAALAQPTPPEGSRLPDASYLFRDAPTPPATGTVERVDLREMVRMFRGLVEDPLTFATDPDGDCFFCGEPCEPVAEHDADSDCRVFLMRKAWGELQSAAVQAALATPPATEERCPVCDETPHTRNERCDCACPTPPATEPSAGYIPGYRVTFAEFDRACQFLRDEGGWSGFLPFDEAVKTLAAARAEGLDGAWAEVERALPEGRWLRLDQFSGWYCASHVDVNGLRPLDRSAAPTPVEALRNLAQALAARARRTGEGEP